MISLALKNLGRRPARTALTTAGVVLAVFLAATMFSLVEGMDRGVAQAIGEGGVDMFVTQEGYPPYLQDYSQIRGARQAAMTIGSIPHVTAASPYLVETVFILPERDAASGPGGARAATGLGYVPELNGNLRNMQLLEGAGFAHPGDPFYEDASPAKDHQSDSFTGEAMVNSALAELAGLEIGDRFHMLSTIESASGAPPGGWPLFTVSGLVREPFETGTSVVAVVHLSELQYVAADTASDPCSKFFVSLDDWESAPLVASAIENATFPYSQRLEAATTDEFHAQLGGVTDVFAGFSRTILVITFAVTVAFVSTVMMVAARERVREMGVMRAIGISRGSIAAGLVAEAMVICLIGMAAGISLGWGASSILDEMIRSRAVDLPSNIHLVYFTPAVALRSALTALAMGAAGAAAPAAYVMRSRAAANMRDG